MNPLTTRRYAVPLLVLCASSKLFAQTTVQGSRMAEVFQQTTLSPANALNNPWEVTYGPDGYLWITESRGYKVYRMNPNTGAKTTILDLSQGSTFLPAAQQSFNLQFNFSTQGNPQGGLAGLALHPKFLDPVAPKNYVYISYIHLYNSTAANNAGVFFTNSLVRFTYNTTTGKLESPVTVCDTLPGSSDHNSQRMIVAPVNGTDYLFYAQGDMGAGQFGNANRTEKAQIIASYEGKILRFNLEPDGNTTSALDSWIPDDNPFNAGGVQSAVWSTGIRNNQGFASVNINGTDYLYGSSHGPFSDDEINIIQRAKNYGHPLVIGFNDGNYDNARGGINTGALPLITSEASNVTAINSAAATANNGNTYQDPVFTFYPAPKGTTTTSGTIQYIYSQFNSGNGANGGWPSEAPSGMDIYTNTVIPGWKNSLVLACLKWGRVMKLKLSADGSAIVPTNGADTVSYFNSTNRYRDLAFAPNGKDLFLVMDGNGATSGPSAANPSIQACPGCVVKYTFLGYANNPGNGNRSTIPTSIPVTTGTNNTCNTATTITIDATNNNLWVPITGPDGNIMAEIKANGNNLGNVTASFYTNSGTIRKDAAGKPYLDRNMTITPTVQPTSGVVDIRLYITNAELNSLISATGSGVTSVTSLHIFKNVDACGSTLRKAPLDITPAIAEPFGTGGNVLQASISSFSSFYFGSPGVTLLPLQIVTFKAALQPNDALLQWETANEQNTAGFNVERSTDEMHFEKVGTVAASGNRSGNYAYTDKGAALLSTGVLYYRLKIMNKDGAFVYSNVVNLHVPYNVDVMVFPNPVKSTLNIRINSNNADAVTVQVSDVQGRVVYTGMQSLQTGFNTIAIDVRRWNAQLYIVKVINSKAEVLATQKFEKAN